jgi:hypothetical protein
MNKIAMFLIALALVVGGFYLGKGKRPEPTVIRMAAEPKAAFSSEEAQEVAAAGAAPLRSLGNHHQWRDHRRTRWRVDTGGC